MIVALRVEVNVIAASILLILIQNKRRTGKNMLDERLYQMLLCASFLYAIADTVAWLLDGTQADSMRLPLYAVNILCYLFCLIVPYIWLLYVEIRLFEDEEKLWKLNRFLAPPLIVYALLVVVTPLTGWMFSFNENQMYQRGPLFLLQAILTLLYMLFPTFRALHRMKKTSVTSERQECYTIAGFIIFPLVGFIIQVLFYGMPVAIIATVVGELMIYINVQNKQISLDALTRLNNRGQLNRYLSIESKKEIRQGNMYMLLLDIDRFKAINDTYGHKVGDQALIDMAVILQKVCGRHGGFLARYGGDEFSIIIDQETDGAIVDLMNDIQAEVDHFNNTEKRVYKLAISIGYAMFGKATTQTVDQLLEEADGQMYEMKMKRHAQQDSGRK